MTSTTESAATARAEGMDSAQARTLVVVATAHWLSHFHHLVLPPLFPVLKDLLGIGFVELGLALTVSSVVSGLTQAPMGFLADRYGPQRILVAGLCLGGAAFVMLGASLSFPMLLLASALLGLANSVYHPCDYALLAAAMSEKRMGRAFSIHTFAGFFGGAVAPAIVLFLVWLVGVPWTLVIAGLMGPAAALLVATTRIPQTASVRPAHSARTEPRGKGALAAVLTPGIIVMTVFFALLSLSNSGLNNFSVSAFMQSHGLAFSAANVALTAYLAAGATGVLAGGWLADRTRRHGHVAVACFAANAVIVGLLAATTPPGFIIIAMMGLAGFLGGIIAPSRDMLVRKAAPPGAAGAAFGIVSTGFNVAGIAGPLMYGFIMDHGWPRGIFAIGVGFMAASIVLTLATERWLDRKAAG